MRPLPEGLSVCADCGDVRGKTPDGRLSVCYCQGVVCDWCGARSRRPISDHYVPRADAGFTRRTSSSGPTSARPGRRRGRDGASARSRPTTT